MATAAVRTTPFHSRTAALVRGHTWRHWAGYVVPASYDLIHDLEYAAIRGTAGLIDVTPLYKYRIHGPGAGALLDRVVTRDVARSKVGQVLYTPWCDPEGKVLDDGTVTRLEAATGRIVGEPIPVGRAPLTLAWDGEHLWVGSASDHTVQAILP